MPCLVPPPWWDLLPFIQLLKFVKSGGDLWLTIPSIARMLYENCPSLSHQSWPRYDPCGSYKVHRLW